MPLLCRFEMNKHKPDFGYSPFLLFLIPYMVLNIRNYSLFYLGNTIEEIRILQRVRLTVNNIYRQC